MCFTIIRTGHTSNGIIAQIVLCNLGLLFEGKKIINLTSNEAVRAGAKVHGQTFVDIDIYHGTIE